MSIVYLLCGFPGAGKSTFTKETSKIFNAQIVEVDKIRYHNSSKSYSDCLSLAHTEVLTLLYNNQNVLLDGCYKSEWERKQVINAFRQYARVICIDISTPIYICKLRDFKRKKSGIRQTLIPDKMYEDLNKNQKFPVLDEGFEAIYSFDNLTEFEKNIYLNNQIISDYNSIDMDNVN